MHVGTAESPFPDCCALQRYRLKTWVQYYLQGWKTYTRVRISRDTLAVRGITREPVDPPWNMTLRKVWNWSARNGLKRSSFTFSVEELLVKKDVVPALRVKMVSCRKRSGGQCWTKSANAVVFKRGCFIVTSTDSVTAMSDWLVSGTGYPVSIYWYIIEHVLLSACSRY
jgi:hypothetical protein